jgi:uncharacterized membrane protein YebE (DUF533 family)
MSIGSILSGIAGTGHAAFSTQSATSSASEELHKLFSKLHMDAIASVNGTTSTSTGASTTGSTSTSTSSTAAGGLTDVVHSLRHILDGGISAAKEARTAVKTAASAYAHGGVAGIAAQVLDKVA